MWELPIYILISVWCIWFALRLSRNPVKLKDEDEEIRERFRKALSDPAVSFLILRMLRDLPSKEPQTGEEKRRAQKYNLLRARLDNLVEDKEILQRINSFIERKRKDVERGD